MVFCVDDFIIGRRKKAKRSDAGFSLKSGASENTAAIARSFIRVSRYRIGLSAAQSDEERAYIKAFYRKISFIVLGLFISGHCGKVSKCFGPGRVVISQQKCWHS